jgi:hypothetical protein
MPLLLHKSRDAKGYNANQNIGMRRQWSSAEFLTTVTKKTRKSVKISRSD